MNFHREVYRSEERKEVDFRELANKCLHCGLCTIVCPVYREEADEYKAARGRNSLAVQLSRKKNFNKRLAEQFYACTLCLNCRATCPAGVQVADIVTSIRRRIVEEGKLPEVFKPFLENILQYGNPFSEPAEKRMDVYPSDYKEKTGDTLLFFGCVTGYQDIHIVPNTIKIFDQLGMDYSTMGKDEYCCGYLAYLTGSDQFKKFVNENLERFARFRAKRIITTCAGCHKAFRDLYPRYSNSKLESLHIVEYLEQLILEGKMRFERPFPKKVVYHDPCDLGRHLKIYEPPRRILRSIPGLQLMEFKENRSLAKCCGGGGGLKAFNNNLSIDIACRRASEAIDMGAEVIVSACPTCKSSFQQSAARLRRERKGRIQVMDITEIVAEALL